MARKREERTLRQPKITVIGEGLTERCYFTHLRNVENFRYDCKPRYFTEQSYEEMGKLIENVLTQGGIAVCVCDADITRNADESKRKLTELKDKYVANDRVIICDSMPSIEFWFLLHYLNTSRHFNNSNAVITALRKWIPEYEKNGHFLEKPSWVEQLCSENRLADAYERASGLSEVDESYSNIFKAIELFKR